MLQRMSAAELAKLPASAREALLSSYAAIDAAEAETAKAKAEAEAAKAAKNVIRYKVSEKGALSAYGINSRFPVTLYKTQWLRLLDEAAAIRAFIVANDAKLTTKEKQD